MSTPRVDKELEHYRTLVEVPSTFEDGFGWTSFLGTLFVAALMIPGTMYMKLLAGYGVGQAAQWMTVILFIEVARRAHKQLRRGEVFVLFYIALAAMLQPLSGILYNQFFAQSQAATGMGVAEYIPIWYSPTDPDILAERNLLNPAWYPAIGIVIFHMIMGRINSTFLSYGMFRLASDIERLPFPMANIGAEGIAALVEQQYEESQRAREQETESWRWRVFSVGGVLGLSFGLLYLFLPAITTAVLDEPISILPIPFVDFTQKTSGMLDAVATGLSLNIGQLVIGMVLPFFAVMGSFLGYILQFIANPILYDARILTSWDPTDDTILTMFKNIMDFYFSFSFGIMIAVALTGIYAIVRSLRRRKKAQEENRSEEDEVALSERIHPDRGDMKPMWVIVIYLATTMCYITLSGYLINWNPNVMATLFFFGFIYTPMICYFTVRIEGAAGQVVQLPVIRQAAFILSGYQGGVDIWLLPVPFAQYGVLGRFYRVAELTGTRFFSIWKAELALIPIIIIAGVIFAQFIWQLAEIPGPEYPYADRIWELNAATQCIMYTSTLGRFSKFQEAFNWKYLATGTGVGVSIFALTSLLRLPAMLFYGLAKGLTGVAFPHVIPTQFIGALIGRFYFERRMGLRWRQYIPVAAAGFACGMGLITVLGIGVNFLANSVIQIPF
ncbi:MAG: peptide transporter [Planctomycetota bacterium]